MLAAQADPTGSRPQSSVNRELIERHVVERSNRTLERAALVAVLLGVVAGPLALVPALLLGWVEGLWWPVIFGMIGATASGVIWWLARRRRIRGATAYAALLSYVCLPTLFFLGTPLFTDYSTATHLTGPISYLYFVLIAVTGLAFNWRVPLAASAISFAGYLICYVLGAETLASVSSPDPRLVQDITEFPIYVIKGIMMLAFGAIVGAIAYAAKRITVDVLIEQESKQAVTRILGEYVSEEVKDRLLSEHDHLASERKHVAILFSDIREFSTYSEARDPAAVVEQLNEYFDAMCAVINQRGGVIDKLVGDAIMATFGGLYEIDSPCNAAVAAAIDMRERLVTLNAAWETRGLPRFDNGVGVHFGEVVQGSIGSDYRRDFTVIGDCVNTASRVEGLTRGIAPVLITGEVFELLYDDVRQRFESRGTHAVKGRRDEVSVYGLQE